MSGKGTQKASVDAKKLAQSKSPSVQSKAGKGLNAHKNTSHKK